ncbi:hypothetical protein [Methylobacterium fujisawaense]|uniref:hypothetical protein n=1 Tax=Methylobacterium fujisawaense TaxID=107400 RepID=UPI00313C9C75
MTPDQEPLLIPNIENKVGAIVVFAPLDTTRDAERLRRLETYLVAEFPEQRFVVTVRESRSDDAVSAGFLTVQDGQSLMPDAAGMALIGRVLDAVAQFVAHGPRFH